MRRYLILFIILFLFCFGAPQVFAQEVLTWGDCLAEAKKNHPDLIAAQENINQKKSAKTITASGLYPQISADMSASTSKRSASGSSSTADSYSYGVSGTQLLFDGFKTINDIKAASENINVAQQGYRFTSSEVRLNLRTAFISLLRAQELITVSEEIVKIRRDSLVLISLRYQSGLEHKGALLTAEANLAQANFELAQAKRDVEFAQRQLTKEMGRTEFKKMAVKGDFEVHDKSLSKPDFDVIVKNNPSLLEAIAKKNAASFNVKSAYSSFFPQLSGVAGADRSSSHWPPQNNQWDLGLSMSLPIFEGGLRLAEVSQAQSLYKQEVATERSTKDAAVVALEQTWVGLQDAIETVDVQSKSLEAAQERSKIAEAQYSTGFITFDNWIIIEDDLVRAKTSYLNAKATALLAEASWIQAKGETIEYAS